MCQPQTKKPRVKKIKLLFPKASFKASDAVWLLSKLLLPTGIFGVFTNRATINPIPNRKQKFQLMSI